MKFAVNMVNLCARYAHPSLRSKPQPYIYSIETDTLSMHIQEYTAEFFSGKFREMSLMG